MSQILKNFILDDKYQFESMIGYGGMSEIWKAKRLNLNDFVAIKCISIQDDATSKEAIRKLLNEAQNMAALNHPNICKVYDFIQKDTKAYLIMELLEGNDLANFLSFSRSINFSLPEAFATFVINETLKALNFAHNLENSAAILHRDIKPSNIFLTKDGGVKLLDLGISKMMNSDLTERTTTREYTLAYSCYELWDGENYNVSKYKKRHDIFNLGLVYYETLFNKRAYVGRGKELIENIISNKIKRRATSNDSINNLLKSWLYDPEAETLEDEKYLLKSLETIIESFNFKKENYLSLLSDISKHQNDSSDDLTTPDNLTYTITKGTKKRKIILPVTFIILILVIAIFLPQITKKPKIVDKSKIIRTQEEGKKEKIKEIVKINDQIRNVEFSQNTSAELDIQKDIQIKKKEAKAKVEKKVIDQFRLKIIENLTNLDIILDANKEDLPFSEDLTCYALHDNEENCQTSIKLEGYRDINLTYILRDSKHWRSSFMLFDEQKFEVVKAFDQLLENKKARRIKKTQEQNLIETDEFTISYNFMGISLSVMITRK